MKIIFIKTILIINFLIINDIVIGQSDLDNHKKYWYYKSRFNNDFIKVGDTYPSAANNYNEGHGESIPFNERSVTDSPLYPDGSNGEQPSNLYNRH